MLHRIPVGPMTVEILRIVCLRFLDLPNSKVFVLRLFQKAAARFCFPLCKLVLPNNSQGSAITSTHPESLVIVCVVDLYRDQSPKPLVRYISHVRLSPLPPSGERLFYCSSIRSRTISANRARNSELVGFPRSPLTELPKIR